LLCPRSVYSRHRGTSIHQFGASTIRAVCFGNKLGYSLCRSAYFAAPLASPFSAEFSSSTSFVLFTKA
jgi:hypothetical protein